MWIASVLTLYVDLSNHPQKMPESKRQITHIHIAFFHTLLRVWVHVVAAN